ncbi:MAG: hypothetical protein JJ866_27060 [Roseibium sp.]|uniref:capsular biosynthesis protein n=1 Tax=Roseibium sp. TaxID=1936156 RepID=UPI001B215DA4|nr:capsular biosynthesis protein [Roseibium sp.]MBO6895618.1 hypothetical protein [Roseibium sp.]
MIVFPMAGASSRFIKAGYDLPKYMLPIGDSSLLALSIGGFSTYFESLPFMFIYRDIQDTRGFLEGEVARLGIRNPLLVELDALTGGQAETIALGLRKSALEEDGPLTVFNIDTIRPNFQMPTQASIEECDGWLEVFEGEGNNWSFVKPDQPGSNRVTHVTEKDPISNLCCTGLYHFASSRTFLDIFDAERAEGPSQAAEFYVAPLYNRLIAMGQDIRFNLIPSKDVLFSGVPIEYEALRRDLE